MPKRITQFIRVVCYSTIFTVSSVTASELVHQFNSPAFNGQGYSTHVLTIEQLESARKQKLITDM